MDKSIILDELGILYIEYEGHGEFSVVDDGWEDLHIVGLSRDNAIKVRDFLSYWLDND